MKKVAISVGIIVYAILIGMLMAAIIEVPEAKMNPYIAGSFSATTTTASVCPEGTYISWWDGHASDNDEICYASGASQKTPESTGLTVHTDYGIGGKAGALVQGDANTFTGWAVATDDLIDEDVGTIWFSVYLTTYSSETCLVEANDGSVSNLIAVTVGGSGRPNGYYKGNNSQDVVTAPTTTGAIAATTWTRVMYAWDFSNDKHKICIDDADAGECTEDTGDSLTTWSGEPTGLLVGEDQKSTNPTGMTIWVADVSVHSTYDATDPNPDPLD